MYDNLQETQTNKGEGNKYNLMQPMKMIKEKCNKDNRKWIDNLCGKEHMLLVLIIMEEITTIALML
jgi:hypothetical protein